MCLMRPFSSSQQGGSQLQYGPSYEMQYSRRSTADKSCVKYTGFLPLDGAYKEDKFEKGGPKDHFGIYFVLEALLLLRA